MKVVLSILICIIMLFGMIGCCDKKSIDNNIKNENILTDVEIKKLNDINNKIIDYFRVNGLVEYSNLTYNYVDEMNGVVVVGLLVNNQEEQDKFKRLVVDSDLIRFEQGQNINLNANK